MTFNTAFKHITESVSGCIGFKEASGAVTLGSRSQLAVVSGNRDSMPNGETREFVLNNSYQICKSPNSTNDRSPNTLK